MGHLLCQLLFHELISTGHMSRPYVKHVMHNVLGSLSYPSTGAEQIDNAVAQVDAPLAMRAVPDKVRFIILQGPSHASLSEGNVGTETLSCALASLCVMAHCSRAVPPRNANQVGIDWLMASWPFAVLD